VTAPFRRILVAYDGSEPASRALAFGIALSRAGSPLDVVHFVDEMAAVAGSATALGVVDPAPAIEMLDRQGHALLNAAAARCREANVEATTALFNERPIFGIAAAAEKNGDDLVVLGTHARTGLPRAFLGSTTEGVLRTSTVPVLTVTGAMTPPAGSAFRKLLVAVDESDPADAAAAWAARLSRATGAACVLCSVVDTRDLYDKAATYGYDPTELADQMRKQGRDVIDRTRERAGFSADTTSVAIGEDEPARGIITEAERSRAEAIVIGSHGRRGLQRFFLGSVAEYVVRHSPVPVFVLRQ
jgi:nucleotide-binding universal stress UspA family protein